MQGFTFQPKEKKNIIFIYCAEFPYFLGYSLSRYKGTVIVENTIRVHCIRFDIWHLQMI